MADVQTTDINTKPTVTAIDSNDQIYISDGGTALKKISYTNLAKAIIEQYNASQLAGATKTIQAAFNELNSKSFFADTSNGQSILALVKTLQKGSYTYRIDNAPEFSVSGGTVYIIKKTHGLDDTRCEIMAIPMDTSNQTIYTAFVGASATSITWIKQPTRTEVDALNSKTKKNVTNLISGLEVSANGCYLFGTGLKQISLQLRSTGAISQDATIFSVPSEMAPADTTYTPIFLFDTNSTDTTYPAIMSGVEVRIKKAIPSGKYLSVQILYY